MTSTLCVHNRTAAKKCPAQLNELLRLLSGGHKKAILFSPVDEAAFFFQPGLMHEPYALFKVLSPVEHTKKNCHFKLKKIKKKGTASSEGGVVLNLANTQQSCKFVSILHMARERWIGLRLAPDQIWT